MKNPRELLTSASKELKEYNAEVGDCDHSVGICACELRQLIEDIDYYLFMLLPPEERERISKSVHKDV